LICATLKESCCLRATPHADDKAETASASCRDARRCILENYRARWKHAETTRGF